MSVSGLTNQYQPATLDGLNVIEADQIYIDGQLIDLDNLVPYTGATQAINAGSFPVQSSHIPSTGNDLVNFTTLVAAISNQDVTNQTTFLDKITSTPQTVQAITTYLNGLTVSDNRPTNLSSHLEIDANYQTLITSADVSVSQNFGSISSVPPVYQSTTDTASGTPILIGFPIITNKRYRFTIEMLVEDPTYGWYVDFIQSVDNINPITGGIIGVFLIPTGTNTYTASDYTFVALTTGSVIIQLSTDGPSGNDQAVKWKNLTVYEMGVSIENATYPLLTADRVPIINDRHQLVASGINSTKLGYLDDVSSDIQTQLNDKASLTQTNTFTGDNQFQQGTTTTTGITSFKNNSNAQANVGYELAFSNQSTTTKRLGRISLLRNTTGTSDYSSKMGLDVSTDGAIYKRMLTLHPTDGISAGANRIQTSYVPALGDDVLNKTYGDATYATSSALANYLPLTGGTLTGTLNQTAGNLVSFSGDSLKTVWASLGFTASSFQAVAITTPVVPLGTLTNPSAWRLTPASAQNSVAMRIAAFTYIPTQTFQFTFTGVQSNLLGGQLSVWLYDGTGLVEPPVYYPVSTTAANITGTFTIPFSGVSVAWVFVGTLANTWMEWSTFTLNRTDTAIIGGATIGGNVGIGTTTPTKIIQAYSAGGANEIRMSSTAMDVGMGINTTNDFAFLYNRQNFPLVFGTNNAERMRITASGNVGIKTTTPEGDLHVQLTGATSDYWGKLKVKTTSFWGDGTTTRSETAGTQYATMFPMMLQNPHVCSDTDGWCYIRMGRAGGVSTGTWWEVACRADGTFQIGKERSSQLTINPNGNVAIGTFPVSGSFIFNNPSTPLLFRNVFSGNISRGGCSMWRYNTNSANWGAGWTVTNAFDVPTETAAILFTVTSSFYVSSPGTYRVRYDLTKGGITSTHYSNKFFNMTYNHEQVYFTTCLSSNAIGGAGLWNITVSCNGITDINDTIHWSVLVLG